MRSESGGAPSGAKLPAMHDLPDSAFHFVHAITPRFRDTDAFGHVNHAVYLTYLEVARQAYWHVLTGMDDYAGVPFIFAHVTCDFRAEALLGETLEVRMRCPWIGRKSFAFEYRVRERNSGRLVIEATTIQVCYDYAAKQSIEMPAELRKQFEVMEGGPVPARER